MKVNAQNFVTAIVLTIGAVLPWPRRKSSGAPAPKSKKFAFVSDPTGEAVFKAAGTQLITRFAQHKYLGVLTGEALGDYVEVATLNSKDNNWYYFWVREARIYTRNGEAELTDHLINGPGLEKTTAEFDKIVTASR